MRSVIPQTIQVKRPLGIELPPTIGTVGDRPTLPNLARLLAYASWRRHLRAWQPREPSQWLAQYAYVEQLTPYLSLHTIHLRTRGPGADRSRWCLRLYLHAWPAASQDTSNRSIPSLPIPADLVECANDKGTLLYYATRDHSLFPSEEIGARDGVYLDDVYALLLPYQPQPLEVRLAQGTVAESAADPLDSVGIAREASTAHARFHITPRPHTAPGSRLPPSAPGHIRDHERQFGFVRGLRDQAYADANLTGERLVTLRTRMDTTPPSELLRAIEDRKITRAEEWAAAVDPQRLSAEDWGDLRAVLYASMQARARYEAMAAVSQYLCETLPDGHLYTDIGGRLKCERCGFEQLGQDPSLYEADSFLR